MISVNLSKDKVAEYLKEADLGQQTTSSLTVACINSPMNVTISGREGAIDILKERLDQDGIFAHKLKTGVAYHSPSMQTISAEYLELMGELKPCTSTPLDIPMVSTVTGLVVKAQTLSRAQYWVENLISPVRFTDAIHHIVSATPKIKLGMSRSKPVFDLLEIGPHSALRRPCADILEQTARKKEIRYTSALDRNKSSLASVLELVGNLFTYGYQIAIMEVNQQRFGHRNDTRFLVDTPQYPFDHSQRHWSESRMSYDYRMREPVPREVLGTRSQDWNPLEPKWRKFISLQELPWVGDHVVSCLHMLYVNHF